MEHNTGHLNREAAGRVSQLQGHIYARHLYTSQRTSCEQSQVSLIFLSLSCTCLDPFKAAGRCKCFDHGCPSYHMPIAGWEEAPGEGQACGASVLGRQKKGLLRGRCQGPALRAVPGSCLPW